MKTMYDDVGDFHRKFGLANNEDGKSPDLLSPEVQDFRSDFIQEELDEFMAAYDAEDLVKATDALCDLVYVILGTAQMMRLPFNECWSLVQKANMTKVRATDANDPRSKRAHELDVVKPEHFVSPEVEIAKVLHARSSFK